MVGYISRQLDHCNDPTQTFAFLNQSMKARACPKRLLEITPPPLKSLIEPQNGSRKLRKVHIVSAPWDQEIPKQLFPKTLPVPLPSADSLSKITSRYKITGILRSSSYATTYKAEKINLVEKKANDQQKITEVIIRESLADQESYDIQLNEEAMNRALNAERHKSERIFSRSILPKINEGFGIGKRRYTISEYVSKDLATGSKEASHINWECIREIARQLIEHLQICAKKEIILGNLATDNIFLIDPKNNVAILLGDSEPAQSGKSETKMFPIQALPYRAPEVAMECDYDEKIDIWSLGCILAELRLKRVLFPVSPSIKTVARPGSLEGFRDILPRLKHSRLHSFVLSDEEANTQLDNQNLLLRIAETCGPITLEHLKNSYLENDPAFLKKLGACKTTYFLNLGKNPSRESLLFVDLLNKIFVIDPKKRISAQELAQHPFITDK